MMLLNLIKLYLPPSKERQKELWYRSFLIFVNILPLLAVVIGAHIAWQIKTQYRWVDPNNEVLVIYAQALSVVGAVPSGLDIFQTPQIQYPFGEFLGKCMYSTCHCCCDGKL